jgi:hypothetical protein
MRDSTIQVFLTVSDLLVKMPEDKSLAPFVLSVLLLNNQLEQLGVGNMLVCSKQQCSGQRHYGLRRSRRLVHALPDGVVHRSG